MAGRVILSWILLAVIGVANGILRGTTYGKFMSESRAHQISTVTCSAGMIGGTYLGLGHVAAGARDRTLLAVGAGWALATVAFEFGFGRFVAKESWADLLHAYNLKTGQLWSAVPATILIAPLVVKRLARR
jgi:hypothetical protein